MKDLKGKVVVVTGAASGIGRALAFALNREGALLALADKDGQGLYATAEALTEAAASERFLIDVSKRDQVYQFAQDVIKAFDRVDVVINNAGVSSSGSVQGLTYETLQWTIDINLWGTIYGTKAFLPFLHGAAGGQPRQCFERLRPDRRSGAGGLLREQVCRQGLYRGPEAGDLRKQGRRDRCLSGRDQDEYREELTDRLSGRQADLRGGVKKVEERTEDTSGRGCAGDRGRHQKECAPRAHRERCG